MLNSADVLQSLVNKFRAIPELVQEMGGDPENIAIFRRRWPHSTFLQAAVVDAKAPNILIATDGIAIGSYGEWQHKFLAIVRTREEAADLIEGEVDAYERVFWLIVNGVPHDETASGNKMINEMIREDCHPMNPPTCYWEPLMVTAESVIEIFKVNLSINEIGDN